MSGRRSKRGEAARDAGGGGGAACSSCNRRIRIICFEEAEGESGCVRGLRMGCTIASDARIFFEPALLHIKNVQLRMRKTNRNHSSELLDYARIIKISPFNRRLESRLWTYTKDAYLFIWRA